MLGFVDESGTPSRKEPLDWPFFVVGCLSVDDLSGLEAMIRRFKLERGWTMGRELKFSDMKRSDRLEFLTALRALEISVGVLVIDKRLIKASLATLKPDDLYRRAVALAIDHALGDGSCARMTIDEYFGHKKADNHFRAYLRQHVNVPNYRVGDFVIAKSWLTDGLQAADVVTSAVGHAYNDADERYRNVLSHLLRERFWPENE